MTAGSPLPEPGAPLGHYVSTKPFDARSIEQLTPAQEKVYLASQWRLSWWKFKRHKVAVVCGVFLLAVYVSILICEFLAPFALDTRHKRYIFAPPQSIHLFHDGKFVGPFIYGVKLKVNLENMQRLYPTDTRKIYPIKFFCKGDKYKFWGLFKADRHLFCAQRKAPMFLLGTDRLGRDVLSRIIYGARISMTVGLIGVALSFSLGIVIGGIAGYYGGLTDMVVQRMIEVLQSLPAIPLWLALAAIMPVTWSPITIYFAITLILGLLDWTGLARAVRSKLLALREEDYVTAAQLMGAKTSRIIGRHLVPGFMSHLIATATISIPTMILGETALSFLGLGLRPPITSWGVLLAEAQNINVVALYPWLMLPVVPVILVILAYNFLGDGLRDAADPYK
ncbi:MAG: ABC transporter permease [Rhizobiales bacterium]|nr:ABC transporter permease [Hyphomicrobiales bacterium]